MRFYWVYYMGYHETLETVLCTKGMYGMVGYVSRSTDMKQWLIIKHRRGSFGWLWCRFCAWFA